MTHATATAPEPTLDDIAAAIAASDGKTPSSVIEAFLPKPMSHLGKRLVPMTAGHELLLAQLGHPLATGTKWEDVDVLLALFVFSRPSRELFHLMEQDTFQAEFFSFIDAIPPADIAQLGSDLIAHWTRTRASALAMESRHTTAQKKTAASAGSSTPSAALARFTAGCRSKFSMIFRSVSSSP